MDNIPLISEIKKDSIVDSFWYKVYPTSLHKEKDSPWFFPGRDLKLEIEQRNKFERFLIWGK